MSRRGVNRRVPKSSVVVVGMLASPSVAHMSRVAVVVMAGFRRREIQGRASGRPTILMVVLALMICVYLRLQRVIQQSRPICGRAIFIPLIWLVQGELLVSGPTLMLGLTLPLPQLIPQHLGWFLGMVLGVDLALLSGWRKLVRVVTVVGDALILR